MTCELNTSDTPSELSPSEKARLREIYLAKHGPLWERQDYIEADSQLVLRGMGLSTKQDDLHPLAQALLQEMSAPGLEGIAKSAAIREYGDIARDWSLGHVNMAGLALTHLTDSVAEAANTLVIERAPSLLNHVLQLTQPRGCRDYLPTQNSVVDIDALNPPSTAEFMPYQNLAVRFSGNSLQLANASVSIYITRQLLESDDYGAINGAVSAVSTSCAQNELSAFFGLLNDNANLDDGSALFNATDGNLLTGGSRDTATVTLAVNALRNAKINGRAGNAAPFALVVPSDDEMTAKKMLGDFFSGEAHFENGWPMPDLIRVFGVSTEYLDTGSWYLFSDPAIWPCVLRGTFLDAGGQSLSWSAGSLRPGDIAGSSRLEASHDVAYSAVARCGVVRIDMA